MKLTELLLNRWLYKTPLQDITTKDAVYDSSNVVPATVPAVAAGGAAQDINTSNTLINGAQLEPGSIPPATLDVSNWGWGQTSAFSPTSSTQVGWGAGTFTSANGAVYAISSGNTGVMSSKTYIYLDLNVSSTAYQVTTNPSLAVGVGKVLIAVAQNSGSGSATYNLSEATQIVGDNILANSIDASKITTGQLIVGTNVGQGTAVTSGGVTTIIGNTVTTGFVNALSVVAGSVAAENISGTYITGKTIRTAASGARVQLDSSNFLQAWDASYMRVKIDTTSIVFRDAFNNIAGSIYGGYSGGAIIIMDGSVGITGGLVVSTFIGVANALVFTTLWTYHPTSSTGALWYESRSGSSYFVGRQSSGWIGTVDMTAF
jgi:hypothetical protein